MGFLSGNLILLKEKNSDFVGLSSKEADEALAIFSNTNPEVATFL